MMRSDGMVVPYHSATRYAEYVFIKCTVSWRGLQRHGLLCYGVTSQGFLQWTRRGSAVMAGTGMGLGERRAMMRL